jgi:hypothetical protein
MEKSSTRLGNAWAVTVALGVILSGTAVPAAWQAPGLDWAARFGSTNFDNGEQVAVDGSGNVYLTGYFRDTVDFDPGPGMSNLSRPDQD